METRGLLVVLAFGAVTGIGAALAVREVLPTFPVSRGVSIGERVAPDGASPEPWLAARRDALHGRAVRFHCDELYPRFGLPGTLPELTAPVTR